MTKKIFPRMHLRIPTRMEALLILDGETATTVIHELSAGGCLVESAKRLEKGDRVSIAGTFNSQHEKIFRGHVLYSVADDGRIEGPMLEGQLVGVRFEEMPESEKAFLEKVVRENRFKMFRRTPPLNRKRA